MPGAGPLLHLSMPEPETDRVRIETGVRQGDEVSVHYDPMIAKLVVWGPDRQSALLKLHAELNRFNIDGLPNNVNFLMDLASHPEFMNGNVDTDFIPRHFDELFPKRETSNELICAATMAVILNEKPQFIDGMALNANYRRKIDLILPDGKTSKLVIATRTANGYTLEFGDQSLEVSATLEDGQLVCFVDGVKSIQRAVTNGPLIKLFSRDVGAVSFSQQLPKFLSQQIGGGSLGGAIAPMPGVVEKVNVKAGDQVNAGDPLVVMIAMKMEYVIKAPKAGTVTKVPHKIGDFVTKGTALVEFADEE